ncbi:hypothetical protein PGQ11_011017 [Apiospora arundinis]|uniref:Uncharacterized protein n=1 Tax=Apiospora arundinis TaxID=335852 RepID=A0ABR2HYB1_9PEZI
MDSQRLKKQVMDPGDTKGSDISFTPERTAEDSSFDNFHNWKVRERGNSCILRELRLFKGSTDVSPDMVAEEATPSDPTTNQYEH